MAEADPDFVTYVLQASWRDVAVDKNYSKFVTEKLLKAVGEREKNLVAENCGGNYAAGEICGHDFIPLTCSQDEDDTGLYLFRTIESNSRVAIVRFRWPGIAHDVGEYRMVLGNGHWLVDGVKCFSGVKYNM
jgi:hypothetical protein